MDETLKALKQVSDQIAVLKGQLPGIVLSARAQGATWVQVGSALGISPQGAQKRFQGSQVRAGKVAGTTPAPDTQN